MQLGCGMLTLHSARTCSDRKWAGRMKFATIVRLRCIARSVVAARVGIPTNAAWLRHAYSALCPDLLRSEMGRAHEVCYNRPIKMHSAKCRSSQSRHTHQCSLVAACLLCTLPGLAQIGNGQGA